MAAGLAIGWPVSRARAPRGRERDGEQPVASRFSRLARRLLIGGLRCALRSGGMFRRIVGTLFLGGGERWRPAMAAAAGDLLFLARLNCTNSFQLINHVQNLIATLEMW